MAPLPYEGRRGPDEEGRFIQTPEPSEFEEVESELKFMSSMAEWLLWASKNNKINSKRYIAMADYFDTIPVVGTYCRNVCKNIIFYELGHGHPT